MKWTLQSYRSFVLLSFVFFFLTANAQKEELGKYIPWDSTSLLTHPELTLKVKLHLIYRYEDDAQNYTLDSIELIYKQINWINDFYKYLSPSTLLAKDGISYFIPDSRIRFRVDTILKHVDAVDWDRVYTSQDSKGLVVDSVNANKLTLYLKAKDYGRISRADSIVLNDTVYYIASKKRENSVTELTLKQFPTDIRSLKEVYYFKKTDLNCDRYIWEKYTNSDSNYIHIFYTGSTYYTIAFGCGPSPYFLNVSNFINGGGFANAQLIAHELGHTIGLSHTNYPQFDDLPAKDKFGFIPCDSIETSNNIMGYNQCRNYLSPKQVGYVHQLYTTQPDRIRITTANEYNKANTLVIWEDTVWNKAQLITGDIIIKKRQELTIKQAIHLSKGSTIYIEKKGRLIVDGANLSNQFNTNWKGIIYCKSAANPFKKVKNERKRGELILLNEARILNVNSLP